MPANSARECDSTELSHNFAVQANNFIAKSVAASKLYKLTHKLFVDSSALRSKWLVIYDIFWVISDNFAIFYNTCGSLKLYSLTFLRLFLDYVLCCGGRKISVIRSFFSNLEHENLALKTFTRTESFLAGSLKALAIQWNHSTHSPYFSVDINWG